MKATFTVPARAVARETTGNTLGENELAEQVKRVSPRDRRGVRLLGWNEFKRRHGTMAPNRWSNYEAQFAKLINDIYADGNLVVIPSELDERGDAYADTVWIRIHNGGHRTIEAIGAMRGDEFDFYGGNVYRMWWD